MEAISMKKTFWTTFGILAFVCAAAFSAFAQTSATAELRGTVTDPNGGALAGATVTATDDNKGTTRTVTTDEQGNYVILSLPPSTYSVKVTANGFASKTFNNVLLEVGQQLALDSNMTVGNVD